MTTAHGPAGPAGPDCPTAVQLLADVGHALIATDPMGRVTVWNPAAEQLYGWRAEEVLGRNIAEVVVPAEEWAEGAEVMAQVLAGQPWTGVYRVRRRDGSAFPVLVTDAPLRDGQGRVVGVVGVSVEVSEAERTAAALRASEELFRRRFTDVPIAQAVLGLDGRVEVANLALCRRLGQPHEEVVGRYAAEGVHPDEFRVAKDAFDGLVAGGDATVTATLRYPDGQGGVWWGHTSLVLVRDEAGRPQSVAAFVQDVTELRRAVAERTEALAWMERSERRFRALVARAADAALIVDAEAVITYASPAVTVVLGHCAEDVVGRSGFDFVHPDDLERAVGVLTTVLQEPGPQPPFVLRLRHADGRWVLTEETVTNSLDDPDIAGLVLNLRDVTERMAAEQAVAESERRYRSMVENAEEGIWVLGPDGRTTFTNPRLSRMLGRPAAELAGRPPADFAHPDDAELLCEEVRRRASGVSHRYEVRLLHADGTPVWVLVSGHCLVGEDGVYRGAQAMLTDISERRRMEEQLRHSALHDQLTGLANRTLLEDRVGQMLARCTARGSLGAVLFIDVDNFKLVNDSFGHAGGDALLVEAAERMRSAARSHDTVARFGGDEFVVVCEDLHDAKEALDVARRIQAAVGEPLAVEGQAVVTTTSIGIAYTPALAPGAILRDADTAMYRAKDRGRDRVEVFDPCFQETARRELALTADLRAVLRGGSGLVLHYQPVVGLDDQRVVGAEALVRWQHPVHGTVGPAEFVPLAERAGLVVALDGWVLAEACRQTAAWVTSRVVDDDFVVAVNISGRHLGQPGLVDTVRSALAQAGLPARRLAVEVTETAVIADTETAIAALEALRTLGVSVSLDDFGTGYSSLVYLKRIPADRLKIDRTFVGGLGDGGDDDAIVASLVSLARSVGLGCIAEGVETPEQLAALRSWGCTAAQGYLWSRPVPAEELPSRLRRPTEAPAVAPTPRRAADERWAQVDCPTLAALLTLHRDGASLQTIAGALNRAGLLTPRGTRWRAASVARAVAALPADVGGAAALEHPDAGPCSPG